MSTNANTVRTVLLFAFLLCHFYSHAQKISGQVVDTAGKPLPFATIKFAGTREGMIADLDGKFTINKPSLEFIEVSYLNYETRRVSMPSNSHPLLITLQPAPAKMEGVVVRTTSNKLKRILNTAVANRWMHNPDKYDWYQCHMYYKMIVDFDMSEFVLEKDTSKDASGFKKMQEEQHVMITETFSKRTWQKPASLQEEVLASRMSGFKKPLFSGLVTDVLPFHAYTDFINLNGREYNSPLSKGLYQRFTFKLSDEILQGKDTMWVINFDPKQIQTDLGGTVYIHSNGFAIAHIIAHTKDTAVKRYMGIEQEYMLQDGKWFPRQLNYIVKLAFGPEGSGLNLLGHSVIDSITFVKEEGFHFDRAHTVKLAPRSGETTDTAWSKIRPVQLDRKEARTYVFMDSTFKKHKVENLAIYAEKLVDGKFPLGMFDVNLNRIYAYNPYEGNRLGWGMQTNEKLARWMSVGGWAGYGTGDKNLKYGGFAEVYLDQYKEAMIKGAYYNDLRDPGRLQIHKEIDNNDLRMFLMNRVDKVEGWTVSVQKRFGFLTAELTGTREDIMPQYNYVWNHDSKQDNAFTANEGSLKLRYAFGETTAPIFGKYYSTGSKYPVVYAKITRGNIQNANIDYTQAVAAISWQKNINRVGKERFLLLGGITSANDRLPLSKLFAGNGFATTATALYTFGGMQTMLPYQYYSDRFINFYWYHEFNKPFFHAKLTKGFSTAPTLGLGYNGLYGTMAHPEIHEQVSFAVPNNGYHEAGVMLNNVLRLRLLGMWYLTFNAGYYRHLNPTADQSNSGRFVYSIGFQL
jgi:hypothetical protein